MEKVHTHNQREGSDKSNCMGCWAENLIPVLKEADALLVPVANTSARASVVVLQIRQALFDFGRD